MSNDMAGGDDPRFRLWTTRLGTTVRVCDMTDAHLLNTIRVLRGISPIDTRFNTTPERRRE